MSNVVPIKEISPTAAKSVENDTVMCKYCNHAFYGSDIVLRIDNEFLKTTDYNSDNHKVVSPDGVNVYWLACPSCETINRNGYREIVGGLNIDGMYC